MNYCVSLIYLSELGEGLMRSIQGLLMSLSLALMVMLLAPSSARAYDNCTPQINTCASACCNAPPKFVCPDGLVGYPGIPGLCVPPYRAPGCPDGFSAVPLPSCPPGYYRNPNDTRFCERDPYYGDVAACPWGTHAEITELGRACIFNFLGECRGDEIRLADGTCAPNGRWTGSYDWICLPTCAEGTYRDYRRPFSCLPPLTYCPQGYVLEDGRCLPDCYGDAVRDNYGNCVPREYCPPGYEANYWGECIPTNWMCPNGQPPYLDEAGNPSCYYPETTPYDPGVTETTPSDPGPADEPPVTTQEEPDPTSEPSPQPPLRINCPDGYRWVQTASGQWICGQEPVQITPTPKPAPEPPKRLAPKDPPKADGTQDPPTIVIPQICPKGQIFVNGKCTTIQPFPLPKPQDPKLPKVVPDATNKLPKCPKGFVIVNGRCQLAVEMPKLQPPKLQAPNPPILNLPKTNLQ